MTTSQWGADVPVSMPQPLPAGLAGQVPMGGFTMTELGLFHDLSRADHERLTRPAFAPYNPQARQKVTIPEVDGG